MVLFRVGDFFFLLGVLQFASVDFIHLDMQAPSSIKNRNK